MTATTTTLVTVVHGERYERYAAELIASAEAFFKPTDTVSFQILPGRPGWPDATLYRYHVILEHRKRLDGDFIFLVDADMRFEAEVGPEILAPLAAVRHPGFVSVRDAKLPFERRPASAAYVPRRRGGTYYAGAFIGGERDRFLALAETIAGAIDRDAAAGLVACWHDESHLNRALIDSPPAVALSPSYCYPDDDTRYVSRIWRGPFGLRRTTYQRRLVALDKVAVDR